VERIGELGPLWHSNQRLGRYSIEIPACSSLQAYKCRLHPLHLVDPTRTSEISLPLPQLVIIIKMSSSNTAACPFQGGCYFSIQHNQNSSHFNDETPLTSPFTPLSLSEKILSDPSNPLLAYRPCLQSSSSPNTTARIMSMDSILQLQTQVAYMPATAPRRPQPQPIQNVLDVSYNSADSDASPPPPSHRSISSPVMEVARCSRCHRSTSIDTSTGKAANMVSYGLNSFYCTRCANIVGFHHR
jgi:hypothetical protein